MRKIIVSLVVGVFVLSGLFLGGRPTPAAADGHTILQFNTMVGVPPTFTNPQNPIREINGGGIPWMLTSASGKLKSDGSLEVEVEGLVLAAGPLAGTNPIANFKAIVSCLTTGGAIDNESTGLFPATMGSAQDGGGDAQIEATLSLPQPCIAPIIFVTSPTGNWFAATGR